jgi:hypothetical protein
MTLTISAIASIMIIGALIASPDAYSAKNQDVLDECKCEKPHTLKVLFTAPDVGDYRVEIFKKLDDKNNEEKLLDEFSVTHNEIFMVVASNFGKDKLESNTAFVFYEVDGGTDPVTNLPVDVIVASMEIHTSCSKPLFIGQTVSNNGYSLEVKDGLAGMDPAMTSIPIADSLTCEDEKKKSTGSITVKKTLTNDNGGTATEGDFTITVTNVETTDPFDLVSTDDPTISTRDVPAGTYKLSETVQDGYTTVLIAGDTGCPSMVDEEFTIKKGKNLSCIIYNDDNGDGDSGGEIEPGVIFHTDTVQFDLFTVNCNVTNDDDKNIVLPCAIFDGNANFIVVPKLDENEKLHETTLVLLTVIGLLGDETPDPAGATGCTLEALALMTGDELTDPFGPDPGNGDTTLYPTFSFQCSSGPMSASGFFNANYALIETAMP